MWVFSVDGFFSTVKHFDNDLMVVRSRAKEDLENLKNKLKIFETVHLIQKADYPFRIFLTKDQWKKYLELVADDLDYCNFKNEVGKYSPKHKLLHRRLDAYYNVWNALRRGFK